MARPGQQRQNKFALIDLRIPGGKGVPRAQDMECRVFPVADDFPIIAENSVIDRIAEKIVGMMEVPW